MAKKKRYKQRFPPGTLLIAIRDASYELLGKRGAFPMQPGEIMTRMPGRTRRDRINIRGREIRRIYVLTEKGLGYVWEDWVEEFVDVKNPRV